MVNLKCLTLWCFTKHVDVLQVSFELEFDRPDIEQCENHHPRYLKSDNHDTRLINTQEGINNHTELQKDQL